MVSPLESAGLGKNNSARRFVSDGLVSLRVMTAEFRILGGRNEAEMSSGTAMILADGRAPNLFLKGARLKFGNQGLGAQTEVTEGEQKGISRRRRCFRTED